MKSRIDSPKNLSGIVAPAPSPMPVIDKPQAMPQYATSSETDDWDLGMIQTQNELSKNPTLRCQLSKRGF